MDAGANPKHNPNKFVSNYTILNALIRPVRERSQLAHEPTLGLLLKSIYFLASILWKKGSVCTLFSLDAALVVGKRLLRLPPTATLQVQPRSRATRDHNPPSDV